MMQITAKTSEKEKPDRHFAEPMSIVNRDDLDYLTRLDMLQTWLTRVSHGKAEKGSPEKIQGAIVALESRAKLKMDTPENQPQTTTYGGVERSDLRVHAIRRMFERLGATFRR
jgi:hypothetical protein